MKGAVWGPTFKAADDKLNQIKQDYINYRIPVAKEMKSVQRHIIEFENGDIWKAMNINESHKGEKVSVSYIHHSLMEKEYDLARAMIRNCTMAGPWHGFCIYG